MKVLIFVLFLLGLTSCANKEDKIELGEGTSDEFLDDGVNDEELMVDDKGEEASEFAEAEASPDPVQQEMENSNFSTGEMGTYLVENGETLMQAAFKIYGDYRKWKHLMSVNNLDSHRVKNGTTLKYEKPSSPFFWKPQGNPYLIKTGDTLGTISQEKYNTAKRWKDIYENNKPMIRDPNLIFAGFTLYYIPDARGTASQ